MKTFKLPRKRCQFCNTPKSTKYLRIHEKICKKEVSIYIEGNRCKKCRMDFKTNTGAYIHFTKCHKAAEIKGQGFLN